jgi:hypothetical protein
MGILIIFLIFTYRLKLKVKAELALTLDERVKICFLVVVRDGPRRKWRMSLLPDILKGIQ